MDIRTGPEPQVQVLLDGLRTERLTRIVDVGANPINPPPYLGLLEAGRCEVVGFEPQAEALARLNETKGPHETYLPHAVGDGGRKTLNLYASGGFTSLFLPDVAAMRYLGKPKWGKVTGAVPLQTVALDDCPEVGRFDLLKIDIQGGEVMVFEGARTLMSTALAVITEVRFFPLYEGEPMLGGADTALRSQGFFPHKFMFSKAVALPSSQLPRLRFRKMRDQLLDGDAVYLRDLRQPARLTDEELRHLAILAAGVFQSHSLVLWALDHLVQRNAVAEDLPQRYADALPAALRADG
ncbi:MAG: FkbM family methyltransferase [Gemmobacter sp.]